MEMQKCGFYRDISEGLRIFFSYENRMDNVSTLCVVWLIDWLIAKYCGDGA